MYNYLHGIQQKQQSKQFLMKFLMHLNEFTHTILHVLY